MDKSDSRLTLKINLHKTVENFKVLVLLKHMDKEKKAETVREKSQ